MKLYKLTPQKNTAQAMVEFAIVLPILLLLLYGLLEAGRLLFIYSTIVTASRQAARYGSATGEGINPGIPRYQDCAGIRVAANRVDFLNAFDEYDVNIQWDTGPGTTVNTICTNSPGNPPNPGQPLAPTDDTFDPTGDNNHRLIVTIWGDFNPIVPRIVPFIARTRANNNPIRAVSSRTIITGVPIEVTPPPGPGPGPSPTGLTLTITPTPPTYNALGQVITFAFTLTNDTNPPINVTGPFTITHTFGSVTCPDTDLAPGATATCPAATYVITQSDLDTARTITITAKASNGTLESNEATASVTADLDPALSLSKSASPTLATVGDSITYTFTLANTGNVSLSPPFTVSDDRMGAIDCGSATGNLAPGASVSCTPVYVVNSAHVRQNQVVNTATATAVFNAQTVTSNQASATIDIYTGRLFLTVSASPGTANQVGQVITYTYTIKNNWNQDLTDPYGLAISLSSGWCPFSTGTLAPSATKTCTGTYTVTQADFEAGVIRNTVIASATRNNSLEQSNTVVHEVTVTGQNPALSLQATASPLAPTPPSASMPVGQIITYTYTLTNAGNVTLSAPMTLTDSAVGSVSCTPPLSPSSSLAPGAAMTCTGTHTVTDADLSAGVITSQATATALFAASSQTVSATAAPVKIVTYDGPRLNLKILPNPTTYPASGQMIVLTYTLTNTGTVPLSGPYLIQDPDGRVTFIDCLTATSPLASGASTSCLGSTNVSGPAGSTTTIRGIATASDGTRDITSNTATATVSNPVLGCNTISASLAVPGNTTTMIVTINNPNSYSVTIANVVVTWNNDAGHQQGNENGLILLNARLGSAAPFWNGPSSVGPTATLTPSTATAIPPGASTITFTFHQEYNRTDGSEAIIINLSTVGCESTPIHSP